MDQSDRYKALVGKAMSDYDLIGWTTDKWVNPEKEDENYLNDFVSFSIMLKK
ncbi:hypothetical protein [Oceanobacillus sp. J11TS1]|uniref:hypothetical protein n=1 Tax=Oceanobacillus sp. J11TS1 TaxID=2807191 RepID=UPI001B23E53A|nr:hypothetical protein [Oceanobacillus sp. J11TS1]GIO22741.1 hypothetical protein J11TS1_13220 [Oceanobacillus sp. J11TS1]